MTRRIHYSLCISIFTVLAAMSILDLHAARFSCPPASMCGFTDSLDSLSESIKQVQQFFTAVTEFFSTVKAFLTVTGFATVVLFLAVIVFSTGLSALGVPRGKFSFILSLAAADAFWFAWETALKTDTAVFVPAMIRSNAMLLAPLALVFCLTYSAPLARKGWTRLVHLIRNVRKGEFSPDTALELMIELDRKTGDLRENLLRDLKHGAKKESFPLSDATVEARISLEKTLKKI